MEDFVNLLDQKLTKDLKKAAATMAEKESRFLVDLFYTMQEDRIRAAGQIRSMVQALQQEPHAVLDWFMSQAEFLENQIRGALGEFAKSRTVGRWSQSIMGIGPVISAGLIANIGLEVWKCMAPDEEKALRKKVADQCTVVKPCSRACSLERVRTASRIWRYAGLDPTVKWLKGQKRPWNASLKVLCWKTGQSFVKVHTNDKDFYGQFYKRRKIQEIERNDQGMFAEQAERILTEKKIGTSTDAYQWYSGCYPDGTMAQWVALDSQDRRTALLKKLWQEPGTFSRKLPPAHIQARSERYAVKLFLSHWHMVAYRDKFGELPPKPYVLDILKHQGEIQVPNWPF